jgi:hypothetical protein
VEALDGDARPEEKVQLGEQVGEDRRELEGQGQPQLQQAQDQSRDVWVC